MKSLFAKVKIFRFWPKTMDYNKAFWPKSRSLFVVLLLQNGRCCEAEICAILLLLRCSFRWYPLTIILLFFHAHTHTHAHAHTHTVTRHLGLLHTESFQTRLHGGKWRKYAVSVSGNLLSLYVDCVFVTSRLVPLPDFCVNDSDVIVSVVDSANREKLRVEYENGLYVSVGGTEVFCGLGVLEWVLFGMGVLEWDMCFACRYIFRTLASNLETTECSNSVQTSLKVSKHNTFIRIYM